MLNASTKYGLNILQSILSKGRRPLMEFCLKMQKNCIKTFQSSSRLYGNRGEKSQLSCAAFETVIYVGCNLAFIISQLNMARVIIT